MTSAVAHSHAAPLRSQPPVSWRTPLVFGTLALILLRTVYIPFANLFPEEAYYWNYGQHLAPGYLDHPPMVAWLIRLGGAVFGHRELGVRVFASVCSLVTSFYAWRLADLLYGRRAAWTALLLSQCLPYFFLTGWIMTPDAPLTACWSGLLYFLARVFFAGSARAWWGVGVCLGLGMLSKYTVALLGPATLIFLALDPASRPWFRRALPYAAVALAVLIFSPVILWNATHHWASFAFQSTGRLHEPRHFSLFELLGAVLLLLTPLGVFLVAGPLFTRGGFPFTLPGVVEADRRRLFARVFTLTPLAVFLLFSLTHRVKLNWTGPLWLAILPLIATRLTAAFDDPVSSLPASPARWLRRGALGTVVMLGVGYLALLQYLAFGLPGIPWMRHTELLPVGWPELARALDRQTDALHRAQPDARVLVVGMDRDFIASEAAFYALDPARAVRETTGPHLFGGISLMYSYWFPLREQEGATLLLVSFDHNDLNSRRVRLRCSPLGPVETAWVQVDGKPVRPFYTQAAYGFHEKASTRRKGSP